MTDTYEGKSRFELVTIASRRARQLLSGCVPRVEGSGKPARLAQLEVKAGVVGRLEPGADGQ